MESSQQVELNYDLKRLMFGLSHTGYTPDAALFDIIDNSVQAKAQNIFVHIRKQEEAFADSRRDNVAAYEVVDDGDGMDPDGMAAALSLAANAVPDGTSLSKFGLGLKAAAQSQGDRLELISSPGDGAPFHKLVVDFRSVTATRYYATEADLTDADHALIEAHVPGGRGTIVRIAEVRMGGHPSVRATMRTLRERADVVYYYFLLAGVRITLHGEAVEPYDVLRTDDAEANGTLDENEWDGTSVRWIQRPELVTLDADQGVEAIIEVTQLVHPQIFDLDENDSASEARKRYRISSKNYGYYVYRNKRLIAWADRFDGVLPQATQQDMYAFRGRIQIDGTADEAFNIDLKKSHIQLSDEARETLSTLSDAYQRKSKRAWERATAEKKRREGNEPNKVSNELAGEFEAPVLPDETLATPDEAREQAARARAAEEANKARMRKEAARAKQIETGETVDPNALSDDDITESARGPENPAASRIFRVAHVDDNALWEPYWDSDHGWSVRINAQHQFGRRVFEDNDKNADLQVFIELILLTMAQAEVQTQTVTKLDRDDAEALLHGYRRNVSEYLAKLCRDLGARLPSSSN